MLLAEPASPLADGTDPGQAHAGHGMMHNRAFFERVRLALKERMSDLPDDLDKTVAFRLFAECRGASALVDVGREIWGHDDHPVVEALIRPADALGVLSRWMRLERFSHTHHRTRVIETLEAGEGLRLVLEHYAVDGRAIDALSHLFVWGVVAGLLERAGLPVESVRLCDEGTLLFEGGAPRAFEVAPQTAHRAEFSWTRVPSDPRTTAFATEVHLPNAHLPAAVRRLIASDVTRAWKVSEVARTLGVSPRSLQRGLREHGESFSELLVTTRLSHARRLLEDARLSLADVAFSAGFSDQAHMTRAARARWMLAPLQFRSLLASD